MACWGFVMKMKYFCSECEKLCEKDHWEKKKTCSIRCGRNAQRKKMRGNTFGFKKGHKAWLGKHHSEETKARLRQVMNSEARKDNVIKWQKAGAQAVHERALKKFDTNPSIKIGKRGYKIIYIPGRGSMYYHHYIFCKHNNIDKIPKGYCIHHKDGNRLNNDLDNLQFMTIKHHDKLPKKTKKPKVLE